MNLFSILKARHIGYLCVLFSHASCTLQPQNSTPKDVNDFSQYISNAGEVVIDMQNLEDYTTFNMSEFIDSILYVPLETTDKSIIGEITQLEYFDGKYFVLDGWQAQALFVFDSTGHYLWKISRIGGGPGEYISLSEFSIDYQSRHIHLLSLNPIKVMVFDFQNNLITEKKLSFYTHSFRYLPSDSCYLFYNSYDNNQGKLTNEYNLIATDNNMEMVRGYLPYDSKSTRNMRHFPRTPSNYYWYGREVRLLDEVSHTIYSINADSLHICYRFNFGSYAFDKSRLAGPADDFESYMHDKKPSRISSIYETHQFLYFSIDSYKKIIFGYYSKEKRQLTAGYVVQCNNLQVVSAKVYSAQADRFISVIEPETIASIKDEWWRLLPTTEQQQMMMDEKLRKIYAEYRYDDNPVLAVFRIK
jgi:hypothetical protein